MNPTTTATPSPPLPPTTITTTLPPTPPSPTLSIYASSSPPTSPSLNPTHHDEILSDLPSRRRDLDTSAYREGLSAAKGLHVQSGFDEGYALGAELGVRVGRVLGVLRGVGVALGEGGSLGGEGGKVGGVGVGDGEEMEEVRKLREEKVKELREEVKELQDRAQRELAVEVLFGEEWVDGEGVWKWGVGAGKDEGEVTFREVAEGHPVLKEWVGRVEGLVKRLGVVLRAAEGEEES